MFQRVASFYDTFVVPVVVVHTLVEIEERESSLVLQSWRDLVVEISVDALLGAVGVVAAVVVVGDIAREAFVRDPFLPHVLVVAVALLCVVVVWHFALQVPLHTASVEFEAVSTLENFLVGWAVFVGRTRVVLNISSRPYHQVHVPANKFDIDEVKNFPTSRLCGTAMSTERQVESIAGIEFAREGCRCRLPF